MKAHENLERMDDALREDHHLDPFVRRAAVIVATLAGLLAVATLLSNEAIKTAIVTQDRASNAHTLYEANEIKRFVNGNDADLLRLLAAGSASRRAAQAEDHAAQLDKHAATTLGPRDGILVAAVRQDESEHATADNQHLLYELAMVALEVGIVLASVAIITRVKWLLPSGMAGGAIGSVLIVVGLLA
jgi:hypothetical protein